MSRPVPHALHARLFRAMLVCFPRPFRQRFAASMLSTFLEGLECRRGSARLRFALRAYAGLITSGAAERLAERRTRVPWRLASERSREIARDIRRAGRVLRRQPAVTLLSITTLAVGLGAAGAVFSLVDAALLHPIALPDPQQLVAIHTIVDRAPGLSSAEDAQDWRARSRSFAAIGAVRAQTVNLTGLETPSTLRGGFVFGDIAGVAGVPPASGRALSDRDLDPAAPPAVVIADAVWRDYFQRAPDAIGRTITLNNIAFTIVGVLPAEFAFPYDRIDVWVPGRFHTGTMSRSTRTVAVFARLAADVDIAAARSELGAIAAQLGAEYPDTNRERSIRITPMHEWLTADVRGRLTLLFAFVLVLLTAACANVTSLQLGAMARRRGEIGVRVALGASRARVVRELVIEQLVIAGAAAIAATALTVVVVPLAVERALEIPGLRLAGLERVAVDLRVGAFVAVLAGVAALASGLAPAWQWSARLPVSAIRAGGRTGDRRTTRVRLTLVAAQLALAAVLITAGGFLVASALAIGQVSPGFDAADVWSLEYRLPANKYNDPIRQAAFHDAVVAEAAGLPGVTQAAVVRAMPFSGNGDLVEVGADTDAPGTPARTLGFDTVSDGYFAVMRVPVLEGRTFDVRDHRRAPLAVVVSRAAAEQLFGSAPPIGRTVVAADGAIRARVIGVVGDVRQYRLVEDPQPTIYVRNVQNPGIFMTLVARTAGDVPGMANQLRRAVWRVDGDQPVWKVRTVASLVAADSGGTRFMFAALVVFGLASIVLVASGLYGVISEGVHERRREMGLRLALGAGRGAVIASVMRAGLKPAIAGLFFGLVASIAMSCWLQHVLYRTPPLTMAPYVVTALLLAAMAALSCYLPARQAARVDPARALRD